jgi:hypothetical protein
MMNPLRLALLGSLALGFGAAQAQTTAPSTTTPGTTGPAITTPGTTTPSTGLTDTRNPGDRTTLVEASALEAGANSFTEGQARSRMEDAGFTAIEGLAKDDQGFWRGRGMRNGQVNEVALDFRGRIAAGTTLGALGSAVTGGSATTGTTSSRPDGTPGNPPGTAASRALDSAAGTNTSGANPSANRPDGTPGNPPSTAVGRTVDQMQGQPSRPDGTPGNPPGTAAGRAMDRATGTNTTGTNPDGTTPSGTTPPANR